MRKKLLMQFYEIKCAKSLHISMTCRAFLLLIMLFCSIPSVVFGATKINLEDMANSVTQRSYFYCVVAILMLGLIVFFGMYFKRIPINEKNVKLIIILILVAGFIMRLIIAYNTAGFGGDIASFKAWAYNSSSDFFHFYSSGKNGTAAYTPAYIYVLAILGGFMRVFAGSNESLSQLFIKLPAIIADLGLATVLYKTFKRKFIPQVNIALILLIVLNPLLVFNSSVWGQTDSILVLLLAVTLILMAKDKQYIRTLTINKTKINLSIDYLYLSTFFMAITILFKPQAVFFMPILLLELIRRKNIKQFLISAAVGIGTFFAFTLPFVPPAVSKDFPLGGTPLWIFNLYMNAGDSIKCASVNALNFFGMLGKNWVPETETFIFGQNYNTWGYIFMGLGYLITAAIFIIATMGKSVSDKLISDIPEKRSKANFTVISAIFLAPILMNIGFFMFGARMHERYMIPAVILLIFAFAYIKDVRILIAFVGFTITNFMNVLYLMLLYYNESPWLPKGSILVIGFSAINVALALFTFYVAFDILVLNHRVGKKWIL